MSTSTLKPVAIAVLKLLLVIAIFTWLIQKGHIEIAVFRTISWTTHSFLFLLLSTACVFIFMILQTWRAKWLFDTQTYHVPIKKFVTISWIGYFFCTFLPGGVTSDVVKYGYLHRVLNRSRTVTALVLLIDRASGLLALVILTFVGSCLAIWQTSVYSEELWKLWSLTFSILIGAGGLIFFSFHPTIHQASWLRPFHRFRIFQALIQALETYRNRQSALWGALIISILAQGFYLSTLYFLQQLLYSETLFSLLIIFALFPTGVFVGAIPIAPQGFGVSQVALLSLATLLHIPETSGAITLFTALQILGTLCFLTGAIPYIGYKQGKAKILS